MKTSIIIVALLASGLAAIGAGQYQVVERGANYSVLQRTTVENGTNCVHRYIELATGLNYTNSYGQLVESKEAIDILPQGGAAATQGRHQVYFPADIYNGVLEVVTPDGRHLKSRPLGVSYDDGNNTAMIATLKHSSGVLTSSNQVTYFDAFAGGIKADLVCSYRRGGFESDLVFREQPSTPDAYGLTGTNSTLQMITEFFNTADPRQISAQANRRFGLQDNSLTFGAMTMGRGKAFVVGSQKTRDRRQTPVYKRWLHLQGRTFLIEEVPLVRLAADFDTLPLGASIEKPSGFPKFASQQREFPPAPGFVADTNRILIASADLNQRPGVVLDYNIVDSDQTDFTFRSGVTYYVTGEFGLYGTATFEGGTVIKIDEGYNGGPIDVYSAINNQSDSSHPVVITSANDDSVGEVLPGSSGSPNQIWNNTMNAHTNYIELDNFRFNYAAEAFFNDPDISTNVFWNCEFNNGDGSIGVVSGQVVLRNVLGVWVFFVGGNWDYTPAPGDVYQVDAQHVTSVNLGPPFITSPDISYQFCFNIKNSIIIGEDGEAPGIANWDDITISWLQNVVTTNMTFEAGANGQFYLPINSSCRDAGTTDIDPVLLAELPTMTTYAPQDGGWPDTNPNPDIGYHYPEHEYYYMENANGFGLVNAGETNWILAVLEQPASQTVRQGSNATFSVTATGAAPLSYQWQFNGTDLAGATSPYLTIADAQTMNAGGYSVVVTNLAGSVTSSNAVLTVLPTGGTVTLPPYCIPAPGLISWWRAEINALDSAGTNNGTLLGGASFAPGEVGQAFLFNSPNAAVKIPASPSLNVGAGGGFTIEGWIDPSGILYGQSYPIAEWNTGNGTYGVHFHANVSYPGNLYANIVDSRGSAHLIYTTSAVVQTNVFQYVALTYDQASGVATLYCNGAIALQQTLGSFTPQTTYNLYLGQRPQSGIEYAGLMDEVSLYNRALSSSEIAAIYHAGATGKYIDTDYDGRSDVQELVDYTDPYNPDDFLPVQLGRWRFDNTNAPNPWIGDQGQLPLVATNVVGVPGWDTNAALIDSANVACLKYPEVGTNGANLNLRHGTIRFWFRPDWSGAAAGGIGPRDQGRLIEMGRQGTNTGWWTLLLDTNGNTISFITQTNGIGMTNLAAGVIWAANLWHLVVLTYCASNSSLYVDGQAVVTDGLGVRSWPNATERSAGFCIGSDATGNNQARGAFDELETFNYPMSQAQATDSDQDGIPDWWCLQNGLDPCANVAYLPSGMDDGLSYLQEYLMSLPHPFNIFVANPQDALQLK